MPMPNALMIPSGGPKKIDPPEKYRNTPKPMKVVASVTITAFALNTPTAMPFTKANNTAAISAATIAINMPCVLLTAIKITPAVAT